MTSKYSEQEVLDALRNLSSSPAVLDRRGQQTAEEIVRSFVEMTFSSLNSDIDSVYGLILNLVRTQINLCTELISKASELYEIAASATQQEESNPQQDAALQALQARLQQLPFLSGERREVAIAETQSDIDAYLSSGSGGKSVTYAKSRSLELLYDIIGLAGMCLTGASRVADSVEDYMDADFESVMVQGQAERSAVASLLLGGNISDPNEAKLALAILSSLLDRTSQPKRDIREPKYAGPVTPMPGTRAAIQGGTLPLIIRDLPYRNDFDLAPVAEIQYTGEDTSETGRVEAQYSPTPSIKFQLSNDVFNRSDAGDLMPPVEDLTAGPRIISTGDYELDGHLISEKTHTSSIDGSVVPSAYFCPQLKTTVIPGTVSVRLAVSAQPGSIYDNPFDNTIGYEPDDEPDLQTAEILITDTEADGVLYFGDVSLGQVNYEKGLIKIELPDGSADINVVHGVRIQYSYNPFGTASTFVFQSGAHVETGIWRDWGSVYLWVGNHRKSRSCSGLQGVSELVPVFSDMAPEVTCSKNNNLISLGLAYGGTSARIAFPYRRPYELNASPFAPVWNIEPPDLNAALGLSLYNYPQKQGADTYRSEVTNNLSSAILSKQRNGEVKGLSFRANSEISLTCFEGDLSAVAVGDSVVVDSPIQHVVKVQNVDPQQNLVDVSPPVLFEINRNHSESLASDSDIKASITSNRLMLESEVNDPLALLTVLDGGLGFNGRGSATTNTIFLGAEFSANVSSSTPGYTVKPGDVVVALEEDVRKPLGIVQSVDGNVVTFTLVSDNFAYPYNNVEIYALGWSRFRLIQPLVSESIRKIDASNFESELLIKGTSYLNSGSGQDAFYKAVLSLRDNIGELRNHYLDYDAHTVNTTDSLIRFFKEDKISILKDLLAECRFSEVASMTPEVLSSQTSLETKMEEVHELLGGNRPLWESFSGYNILSDYLKDSDHSLSIGNQTTSKDAEES